MLAGTAATVAAAAPSSSILDRGYFCQHRLLLLLPLLLPLLLLVLLLSVLFRPVRMGPGHAHARTLHPNGSQRTRDSRDIIFKKNFKTQRVRRFGACLPDFFYANNSIFRQLNHTRTERKTGPVSRPRRNRMLPLFMNLFAFFQRGAHDEGP